MKNLKKLKLTIVMLSLLALMGCENFRDNSAISIGGADGPTSIIIRENKDDSEIKEVDVTQNVVEVQTGDEWDILPEYIYPGDNPVEKAITEHVLSNNYRYEMKAAVEIPAFCIFMEEVDENDADMLSDYDFSDNSLEESTSATTDYKAAIMVDGKIYLYSPQPMPGEIDNSAIIGYTSSYTDIFPEKDGETNFNREIGMPYAKVEEGIAVLYENEWHLCMPK